MPAHQAHQLVARGGERRGDADDGGADSGRDFRLRISGEASGRGGAGQQVRRRRVLNLDRDDRRRGAFTYLMGAALQRD